MFSAASGEHVNKLIKLLELHHSNFSSSRFQQIMRFFRFRAFHYTDQLFHKEKRDMKCSACHEEGHNKKKTPDFPTA